jgi:hypothetical protein
VSEFNTEHALARSIELWKRRNAEFLQLPDLKHRAARGDNEFFSSMDIELDQFYQEAQRNGFVLTEKWDKETGTVYTIEKMSPQDHAAFLAEDQQEEP